jgi:rhodanese-related sulfurtransferase
MRSFFKMSLGILLSLSSFFVQAGSDVMSPKEVSTLTAEKKAIIIDVREDDEWQSGHIAGAIHIPLQQISQRLPELAAYKDSTVITQCRSGRRSMKALELIKTAGFSNVYSMDGGIQAWTEQGLATTK